MVHILGRVCGFVAVSPFQSLYRTFQNANTQDRQPSHHTNGMYVAVVGWVVGCLVYVGGGGCNSRYFSADNDIITVSRHVPLFLTLILNICRMCVVVGVDGCGFALQGQFVRTTV